MARGRKPKPTGLKLVQGNAGRRPLPANELKPAPSVPDPPKWLSKAALAEWKRLAEPLAMLGCLSDLDLANFAAYCSSYAAYQQAERDFRAAEQWGLEERREARLVLGAAERALRSFSSEFGLTPVARLRLAMQTGDEESDGLDEFLSGSAT